MSKWMLAAVLLAAPAAAEEVGEVTTAIKILGANHRIVIEAFDDPKVEGVACWLSRARTGGIKGRILCVFGANDAYIPKAEVDAIRHRLERERIRHDVVVYPDVGHGFFCDARGDYHKPSADDAWGRVVRLFAAELR